MTGANWWRSWQSPFFAPERLLMFYGLGSGREDVYVASLGLDTETPSAAPVRATERFLGSNRSAEWSPDGRYLAYFSRRNAKASKVLCIQSLESGDYREPPLKLSISNGDVLAQPRWTPDGSALAIRASDRRGRQGIFRVDIETGKETPLVLSGPGEHLSYHSWSRDGEAILFRRTHQGSEFEQIIMRNVKSGKEEELHRTPDRHFISGLAVSPDGRELAFIQGTIGEQALNVMSLAEGSSREIARPEDRIFRNSLAWTPDGSRLLFGTWENYSRSHIWVVSADGGEPRKLDLELYRIEGLSVHPDGERVAFTSGVYDEEIWVMENFLAELIAAK